ncbi:MAG TPA: diguanylate cyclase [Gaiellaceae bacterium]
MGSFKVKLVAYFVLLSLLPLAAAFGGFNAVTSQSETRRVDSRLQAGLRAALAAYQEQLDLAQTTARNAANDPAFQELLVLKDRKGLQHLLGDLPNVAVVAPGLRVGKAHPRAAERAADVITGAGTIGSVIAYVPFDEHLVKVLRERSGLDPSDSLVLLAKSRIIAAAPKLTGTVSLQPGRTSSTKVSGERFRGLVGNSLDGTGSTKLGVLTPQNLIDAANNKTRNRLLLGLLASLALVAGVAWFLGRSIVRTLGNLVEAAHGIARGRLAERVPVRGRDEFSQLGTAFNEMADQLQERLAELDAERARLREAIARFGEALAATHDPAQLLRVIAETSLGATGAAGATLVDDSGEIVRAGVDYEGGERLELPLMASHASFGTLILTGPGFNEEERITAVSLAAQAVVALDNARLHRIVERQALVDGLTGLANRRQCEDQLTAEIARADRFETPLTLVLADLDNFKRINDVHGHPAGDAVLRAFADVLHATAREADVAGRWGGEEFMLLLPGTDADGGVHLAERVRTALESQPIQLPDGGTISVTCSLGVASHVRRGEEEELVAAADEALYRAKRNGRNRVESASSPTSHPEVSLG